MAIIVRNGFLEIVAVFLFVDLFDNIGTLVGVGKKARLFDEHQRIPRTGENFGAPVGVEGFELEITFEAAGHARSSSRRAAG
jgi:hypothetical protein